MNAQPEPTPINVYSKTETDLKLENMEQRLKVHIDKSFQEVDRQFQGVDRQFQSVDRQFQEVNHKIEMLNQTMHHFKETLDYFKDSMDKEFSYHRKLSYATLTLIGGGVVSLVLHLMHIL